MKIDVAGEIENGSSDSCHYDVHTYFMQNSQSPTMTSLYIFSRRSCDRKNCFFRKANAKFQFLSIFFDEVENLFLVNWIGMNKFYIQKRFIAKFQTRRVC